MDVLKFLREAAALPGTPGYERPVAEYIRSAFEAYANDVRIDTMGNVCARMGAGGPRVMVTAHQDEIGLVVRDIEADGSLRVISTGGVDPRVLPAAAVRVMAKGGALYGVVGAKPPHLTSAADRKKALKLADLFVDIGYPPEKVRELVRIGDQVVLDAPLVELADGRIACKTMDDRACVAVMLLCAEKLLRLNVHAEVVFAAASQEEVGSRGAKTAAHQLDPDIAIALDVTHAEGPETDKFSAFPIDKPALAMGPNIHPALLRELRETAKRNRIEYSLEPVGGVTSTDADAVQVARRGVPTLLLSVPLRYMHTSVELIDLAVLEETARLLALFLDDISRKWGEMTWY